MSAPIVAINYRTGEEIARGTLADFFRANANVFHECRRLKNEIRATLSRGQPYLVHGLACGTVELRPSVSPSKIFSSNQSAKLQNEH